MIGGSIVESVVAIVAALAGDLALLSNLGVTLASDLASGIPAAAQGQPAGPQTMERSADGFVLATIAVVLAYGVAALVGKSPNPLVITQGVHRRASLSNLQLLFFTLSVVWVVVAFLTWTGELADLSGDIVVLLGIGAAGTAGGRITAIAKKRLDSENWAWLVRKKWIKESIEHGPNDRKPVFAELLRSGDQFDISKFQLFVFSLLVAGALVYFAAHGADVADFAQFHIPDAYLALIGLSQVAYIGGKAVGPSTVGDLNKRLTEVRGLEAKFVKAVETQWSDPDAERTLEAARNAEPDKYHDYRLRAEEAATIVGQLTGNDVGDARIEPTMARLPS